MLKKIYSYLTNSNFINNEDGVETIEFLGLIAVAAIMIVVITKAVGDFQTKGDTAKTAMNTALDDLLAKTGSNVSTNTNTVSGAAG